MALSFGIKTTQQRTAYEEMLRVWQEADSIPSIEHAWLFDHFMPLSDDFIGPCLEGWTLLAAFAAVTKRVRLGLTVSGNTYRHPAVLTNMAATVDRISGGRLEFGIGAGIHETEPHAYGIPSTLPENGYGVLAKHARSFNGCGPKPRRALKATTTRSQRRTASQSPCRNRIRPL